MTELKKETSKLKIDVKSDEEKHILKRNSSSYRKIFNFCLENMTDSLNAISANLFWNEHESLTFSKLDYELYEKIRKKNYGNLRDCYKLLPESVINNAILNSIGYFNKWKKERIKLTETSPFPKGISKHGLSFFVIGSKDKPVTFSSKGLYLPRCGRFRVLNLEDTKFFKGSYERARIFYQNEDCMWYCQLKLKDKLYTKNKFIKF